MKILKFPLIGFILFFVLGILVLPIFKQHMSLVLIGLGLSFLSAVIFHFFIKTTPTKSLFSGFILVSGFFLGILTAYTHKDSVYPNHYTKLNLLSESKHQFQVKLLEQLKSTQKNNRYLVEVKAIDGATCMGKTIVNFSKKTSLPKFSFGEIILLEATYYENKTSFNPYQFDYGCYLENQEIYAQCYVSNKAILKIGIENDIVSLLSNFRERLIHKIEPFFRSKDNLSVFKALLLGQQQDISPDIVKDYQYAGAVHILSVSGLHVGFIMLFIQALLKPFPNNSKGRFLKLISILFALFTFSILAGMSPSVIRSVVMFSFLAVGLYLKRTVNIYHTILISLFLILVFKPSFLYDIGFQLSYVALFFIVWLQPIFLSVWNPKQKLIQYVWETITISFAAQIGTVPISLYYFHQFPGLFFITNVLILFLVGIIMIVGLILLIVTIVLSNPFFLTQLIEWLIQLLNTIIHKVASLEDFVIKDIAFNQLLLATLYLSIFCIVLYFKNKNYKSLTFAIITILLFQSALIYSKFQWLSGHEGIIFNIRKNSLITARIGTNITIYTSDSLLKNNSYHLGLQSYLTGSNGRVTNSKPIENLLYIHNKKVLLIDSTAVYSKNIQPDILLIVNSPKLNLSRVLQTIHPKIVVVDGSNYRSYSKLWEATCKHKKIPFHNTHEKGFYKF